MSKKSKSKGRWVNLHGMGFLPLVGFLRMKSLPKDSEERAFSFRSVEWIVLLIGVLSLVDLALQAWWVASSRDVTYDPWWAGLLGWSSYDDDVRGVITSLAGISAVPGLALFFVGLFLEGAFLPGMALLISGTARLLGVGLGGAILYAQIRDGLIPADSVNGWMDPYSYSARVADRWPVIAAAVVLAAAALALALLSRKEGEAVELIHIGGSAATFIGLMGITLTEQGLMPTRLVAGVLIAFLALLWLPGEVRAARECEDRRVGAQWQWHAASLIWEETLVVFFGIVSVILDF